MEAAGRLLPGLPDDLALLCLARLPKRMYPVASCVSRAWKEAMDSPFLDYIRRRAGVSETWVFGCVSGECPLFCQDNYQWFLIDPSAPSCDAVPPPPFPPSPSECEGIDLQAMPVSDGGHVLLTGIECFDFHPTTSVSTAAPLIYCFDSLRRRWLPPHVPPMLANRRSFASASTFFDGDGYVYAAGGHLGRTDGFRPLKTAERLEVRNGSMCRWEKLPDMHVERVSAAAVVLHDIFYVIGGFQYSPLSRDVVVQNSGEYWDPRSGKWVLVTELWPEEIFGHVSPPAVAALAGQLCALKQESQEVMFYEFSTRQWTSIGSFPTQRCNPELHYTFSLLGVGEELWAVGQGGVYGPDIFILACTPFAGKPLVWRLLPFSFNFSFLITGITIKV